MIRLLMVLTGPLLASCGRSSTPAVGNALASASDSSAAGFVNAFYSSYTPRGYASGLAALDSVITESPELFAPVLLSALQRDAAARATAQGKIGGLNWEPLLGSQDPCERVHIGGTARVGSRVRVTVYPECNGGQFNASPVVAEVASTGSSWVFTNFLYAPLAGDLLHALRQSQK